MYLTPVCFYHLVSLFYPVQYLKNFAANESIESLIWIDLNKCIERICDERPIYDDLDIKPQTTKIAARLEHAELHALFFDLSHFRNPEWGGGGLQNVYKVRHQSALLKRLHTDSNVPVIVGGRDLHPHGKWWRPLDCGIWPVLQKR